MAERKCVPRSSQFRRPKKKKKGKTKQETNIK